MKNETQPAVHLLSSPDGDPTEAGQTPHRVQLRRTKGWRMPPNTVRVARPTAFGNPYPVEGYPGSQGYRSAESAVAAFRDHLKESHGLREAIAKHLRGKNLACWCPLDQSCHADVLLDLANTPLSDGGW